MIEYLLFDVDDTLYPRSCGLGDEMNRRMSLFVADYLRMDLESANALRVEARRRYGTTLKWLRVEHGLENVDPYMEAIHPQDLSPWITSGHAAEVRDVLERIDLPASVLTNGPAEHALRVIDRLGLNRRFERIFDLRGNNLEGKPARSVYLRVARELGLRFESTLFVDDVVQYLLPFRNLGGMIVHMSTSDSGVPLVPRITCLRELEPMIHGEGSRR
jgi:putative hydrolase of the HAD superfamily